MTTLPIRWGILGTGQIARRFANDLAFAEKGRLAAIGSRDKARADAFAAALDPDGRMALVADTTPAILARADVDAIYVGTVNRAHAALAVTALAAGKPVLIEKPLAVTPNEAAAIQEAASTHNRLAMEAMWMLFTPGIVRLKAELAAGAVGSAKSLSANLSYARPYRSETALFDPESGGALLDLGVYPVALALHLFGPASDVQAIVERNDRGSVRQAALIARHGAVLAKLSCGFETEGPNGATVSGEHGRLAAVGPFFCPPALMLKRHFAGAALDARTAGAAAPAVTGKARFLRLANYRRMVSSLKAKPIPTPYRGSGLQYQADHFAACLQAGLTESPVHPLSASIAALAILDAAMRR
ncbi:Gfo/Idh/MocA family oxidoreductase [Jiella sp. MQZ9-1]|uniref:Gfo/Idh/MocA family oxidoreductase n=1 Tax=Jiella flava TaxID=2816857 RepID=A0A939FYK8_9HYPH|nr:Gfo/Idh/MocA family oxidoreductase [Jiella flava]MBO0662383.1 Gfo/Idh/MocA family oxidoreductase [Jiella flava]MCD2471607.1 Gfo/Idh/MocA family oxidoreductase [Jiella flava]